MTTTQIGQLAAAATLFAAGVALYWRRDKSDGYGSQSAMLMWAAAAIFLILGSGALEYHPSHAELDSAQAHAR